MRLLGTLEVGVGGTALHFPRQKMAHLLANLLLHHSIPLPIDRLAGTLWPDLPTSAARASLRRRLNELRGCLPERADRQVWFQRDSAYVWWNPNARAMLDVDAFESNCRRARLSSAERPAAEVMADLEEAVGLYRGELVPGVADDWIVPFRQRIRNQLLHALDQLLGLQMAAGMWAVAQATAERLAGHDPMRESPQQSMLWLLANGGRRDAALALFDAYRGLLRRRLGIAPGPATLGLAEAIRVGRPLDGWRAQLWPHGSAMRGPVQAGGSPAVAIQVQDEERSSTLPRLLSSFVGRSREMDEVARLLDRARLVTLTGVGGSGKTRLALEVATRVAARFADGVAWVALESLNDPQQIAGEVARVLGVPSAGTRSQLESIVAHLRERTLLLVLDNCEHLIADLPSVAEALVFAGPGVHILATSREKLGIRGESVWQVPPLSLPPGGEYLTEAEVTASEAARLFVERVREVWPEFHAGPARLAAIASICRQLDGIPLAIELAAARVNVLDVEDLAVRLQQGFGLLRSQDSTHPERHKTLSATIEWSHRLLPPNEQVLLRRLAAFADGFTVAAVAAVAQDDAIGSDDALAGEDIFDLIGRLVDKSFVTIDTRHTRLRRFRLLEMIRQFAWDRMAAAGEVERLARRLAEYYVRLAEQAVPDPVASDPNSPLAGIFEAERNNVRHAMQWIESRGEWHLAFRLGAVLWTYWYWMGNVQFECQWMEHVCTLSSGLGPSSASAAFFRGAGALAYRNHESDAALRHFAVCIEHYKALGDRHKVVDVLHNLGQVYRVRGELALARRFVEESLALAETLGRRPAPNQQTLAAIYAHQGESAVAYRLLKESLAAESETMHDRWSGYQLAATVAHSMGAYAEALDFLDKLDSVGRANSNAMALALVSLHRGRVLTDLGDYENARADLKQSLRAFQDMGIDANVALNLHNLGELELREGNYAVAQKYLSRSLAMKAVLGDEWNSAYTRILLGEHDVIMGDLAGARAHVDVALELAQRFQSPSLIHNALLRLARVDLAAGNLHGAASFLASCLEQFLAMQELRSVAVTLDVVVGLAVESGDFGRAGQLAGAADALRSRLGAPRTLKERVDQAQHLGSMTIALGEATARSGAEIGALANLDEVIAATAAWLAVR